MRMQKLTPVIKKRIEEKNVLLIGLLCMKLHDGVKTSELQQLVIKIFVPSGEDLKINPKRNDSFCSQIVRNLKLHDKKKPKGYFVYDKNKRDSPMRITEKGLDFLINNIEKCNFRGLSKELGLIELIEVLKLENLKKEKIYDFKSEEQDKTITSYENVKEYTFTEVSIKPKIKKEVKERTFKAIKNKNYEKTNRDNKELGDLGEELVKEIEQRNLISAGRKDLADKVEIVAKTKGDGLGYDIDSYCEDGSEKLVEVKSTSSGLNTDFILTANEIERSKRDADKFYLYRINVDKKSKKATHNIYNGALTDEICNLTPTSFRASFKITQEPITNK